MTGKIDIDTFARSSEAVQPLPGAATGVRVTGTVEIAAVGKQIAVANLENVIPPVYDSQGYCDFDLDFDKNSLADIPGTVQEIHNDI